MSTNRPPLPDSTMTGSSRQELIDANIGLVYSHAVRIYRQLARRFELGDLVAFGAEGLLIAADRFDPDRGASFQTFAYYRIRGAIFDGVRKLAPMGPTLYRRRTAVVQEGKVVFFDVGDQRKDVIHWDEPRYTRSVAEQCVGRRELRDRLNGALSKLPRDQRRLVERHYFSGTNLGDAGSSMGISKSWASRLHRRALRSLRGSLKDSREELLAC